MERINPKLPTAIGIKKWCHSDIAANRCGTWLTGQRAWSFPGELRIPKIHGFRFKLSQYVGSKRSSSQFVQTIQPVLVDCFKVRSSESPCSFVNGLVSCKHIEMPCRVLVVHSRHWRAHRTPSPCLVANLRRGLAPVSGTFGGQHSKISKLYPHILQHNSQDHSSTGSGKKKTMIQKQHPKKTTL